MICEHGNLSPCVECDVQPLESRNKKLEGVLEEVLEYLHQYADADNGIPNEEMKLMVGIEQLLGRSG